MVHWLRTYRFGSEPRLRTEVMIDLGYVVHMHMLKYMMLATHARVGCTCQCMFEYSRKYIVDIMDHFNVISETYAYLSETRCTGDCKAYAVWCIKLLGTWSTALRGVEYTSAMMERERCLLGRLLWRNSNGLEWLKLKIMDEVLYDDSGWRGFRGGERIKCKLDVG